MMDDLYERGWQQLLAITGEQGEQRIEQLRTFAPDLCDYIVQFAYGQIYSRPGLSIRDRMMVTVTTLLTQGDSNQLRVHLQSAIRNGLSKEELMEVILHCIPYIGFPRVMDAVSLLQQVTSNEDEQ